MQFQWQIWLITTKEWVDCTSTYKESFPDNFHEHVHPDIIKAGTHMGECSSKSYRKSGDVVPKFIKYTYAIISCSTGNQAIHPSTPHTYRFRISQSFEISSTLFLLLWIYCKVMAALSFIIFFHSSLQVLHDCLLASQFPVYNKGGHITFSSHK